MDQIFDVERLLEKRFQDIRHIETERHWLLGSYAVIVAGVLAFLSQVSVGINNLPNAEFAFGILISLSFLGFLHAWRAAIILYWIQQDTKEIVDYWKCDPKTQDISWWKEMWKWRHLRSQPPKEGGWLGNFRKDPALKVFAPWPLPLNFAKVGLITYILGIGVFSYLLYIN